MAKKHSAVHINGRTYDTSTGQVVGQSNGSSPKLIDGFHAPSARTKRKPGKKLASSDIHSSQQKTKKLHPAVARKKAKSAKPNIKADMVRRKAKRQTVSLPTVTSQATQKVDTERIQRAAKHRRSHTISKFSKARKQPVEAVAPEVEQEVPSVTTGVYQVPQLQALQPAQAYEPQQPEAAQVQPEQTIKQSNWLVRQFKNRPRLLPALSAIILTLAVGSYFTYSNIPNMALKLAASRAGFDASLPGYKPAGYRFAGPVAYSPGMITVNFQSNTDAREFQITQQESNWDSQSLLENFILAKNKQYVTFQERGLTVYVFDESNATWVDGGIWYVVEGASLLSSEQLLKIAASL